MKVFESHLPVNTEKRKTMDGTESDLCKNTERVRDFLSPKFCPMPDLIYFLVKNGQYKEMSLKTNLDIDAIFLCVIC